MQSQNTVLRPDITWRTFLRSKVQQQSGLRFYYDKIIIPPYLVLNSILSKYSDNVILFWEIQYLILFLFVGLEIVTFWIIKLLFRFCNNLMTKFKLSWPSSCVCLSKRLRYRHFGETTFSFNIYPLKIINTGKEFEKVSLLRYLLLRCID